VVDDDSQMAGGKVRERGAARKRSLSMVSRRETLGLLGASAASLALGRTAFGEVPESSLLPNDQRWLTHLTDGIAVDRIDSIPTVEGRLPPELSGTLYRNGPGLFERDHYRKSTILDGDGMIRAFTFAEGRVRFRPTPRPTARQAPGCW
jgi:all-trans-8'-apo-beta-carotenal 15,15'-oxygenase